MEQCQVGANDWKDVADSVLPNVFYPVTLPGVEEDQPVIFYMCDVRKCLDVAVQKCNNFSERLQNTLSRIPCVKMSMLLYNDEASGGNVLAPSNAKKSSLWYFSLRELDYLWADCLWFPLALLQHSQFEKIKGNFSAAACKIIRELMGQKLEHGFPLQFPNGIQMLRLELRYMLGDLDSIRYCLDAMGSSAIRCCLFCKNAIKKDTTIPEYNDYFQEITNHDLSKFQAQSDGDVFAAVDAMAVEARRLSKSALQKKETASGFHHNPTGLLLDPMARETLPPSSFLLDSMHLYFANGIVSWEINEIYQRWSVLGVGDLQAFLSLNWQTSLQPSCSLSWRKRLGEEWNFQNSIPTKGRRATWNCFFHCSNISCPGFCLAGGCLSKSCDVFKCCGKSLWNSGLCMLKQTLVPPRSSKNYKFCTTSWW